MAYEWERDEWRSAINAMSEQERATSAHEVRAASGVIGDPSDLRDE